MEFYSLLGQGLKKLNKWHEGLTTENTKEAQRAKRNRSVNFVQNFATFVFKKSF
jgi:hypothetical protein